MKIILGCLWVIGNLGILATMDHTTKASTQMFWLITAIISLILILMP